VANTSSSSLNPGPENRVGSVSRTSLLKAANPLSGSRTRRRKRVRADQVNTKLIATSLPAWICLMSNRSSPGSCERSPSIITTTRPVERAAPSRTAEESPILAGRWTARMFECRRASSFTAAPVPSVLASSTTTTSNSAGAIAFRIPSIRGPMFSRSFQVGMIMETRLSDSAITSLRYSRRAAAGPTLSTGRDRVPVAIVHRRAASVTGSALGTAAPAMHHGCPTRTPGLDENQTGHRTGFSRRT
jgi:hypothetical protein